MSPAAACIQDLGCHSYHDTSICSGYYYNALVRLGHKKYLISFRKSSSSTLVDCSHGYKNNNVVNECFWKKKNVCESCWFHVGIEHLSCVTFIHPAQTWCWFHTIFPLITTTMTRCCLATNCNSRSYMLHKQFLSFFFNLFYCFFSLSFFLQLNLCFHLAFRCVILQMCDCDS